MSFMDSILERHGLADIAEKVFANQRLTDAEALRLYDVKDLNALGYLANHVRERKNGNVATYVLNLYLNYSNICILSCQFCAFARRPHEKEGQFTYDIDDMVRQCAEAYAKGATEVHIVGGLHPKLPFSYYTDMVRGMREACPDLTIKAFTAIEIRHLAERIAKKPIRETLEILRAAGLGSLTGGGAEIFDPEVRDKLCRGKESAEEWLEVHRTWHQMGERSTCTMLYGHVETLAQRVDHLRRLRELQDETHGFTALVPFAYEPDNNKLSHLGLGRASAFEDLRTLAIARLYLDNFDHITAYWVSLGLPTGADRAQLRRRRPARHDPAGKNFPHGRQPDPAGPAGRRARTRHPRGGPHPGPAQHLLRAAPAHARDEAAARTCWRRTKVLA